MKYKVLIPIALIGLLVLSVFMTMKNNTEKENEYKTCLEHAREAASFEIYVDAVEYYKDAINMKQDLDVYKELADVYIAFEKSSEARRVGEKMIDDFPYEGRAYAMCASIYERYERYRDISDIYKKFKKQNLSNDDMEMIYDRTRWLYKVSGGYYEVGSFSNGLSAASDSEGKWGYINRKGESYIPYRYKYAGPFIGEIAPVETQNDIWYFIDMEGNKKKVLNEIENIQGIGYVCDAIPVFNGETWAYYTDGQKLLCDGFDEALAMANGYAAVRIGDEWYLVDKAGNKLKDQPYSAIVYDDKGIAYRGFYFAQLNGVYNLYNSEGGVVGSDSYQDARMFNTGGKYAAVKLDGKWGFIDTTGTIVIEPQYEDARSYSNGLAAVKKDGRWGFIDESGKMVINNIFEDAKDLNEEGRILVKDCGTWQLIKLLMYED